MPKILGLFGSALGAANRGLSERAWEREVRAAGMGARSSEMLQLWRIAKKIATSSGDEIFRPFHATPSGDDIVPWPSKGATSIVQNISLTYRDKATGDIKHTFYRIVGDAPISRERATAMAIDAYSGSAERYGQELIGAAHTSTYRLTPGLVRE
jgi:hypothetical protein